MTAGGESPPVVEKYPPSSLLWKRAAYDHPDGVVPRVGDVDVPPGIDGDGQGVVQPCRCSGAFIAHKTNCSISCKSSNLSKIVNVSNIIKSHLTKEKSSCLIIIIIKCRI